MNYFEQIHEHELVKRLNQIEKYMNGARDVLTPKLGYGLADELKQRGFGLKLC